MAEDGRGGGGQNARSYAEGGRLYFRGPATQNSERWAKTKAKRTGFPLIKWPLRKRAARGIGGTAAMANDHLADKKSLGLRQHQEIMARSKTSMREQADCGHNTDPRPALHRRLSPTPA